MMDGLGADLTKFLRELAVVEGGGKVATGLEVVAHRIEELEAENKRLRAVLSEMAHGAFCVPQTVVSWQERAKAALDDLESDEKGGE
jgi:hypothetical protein